MKYFGACPSGVASRSCCATQASVGDRVTPTWITRRDFSSTMKKAKSGRKNKSVTCKKSQAQMPAEWLRRNVLHFCPRGGSVRTPRVYFWMVRLHTRMPNFNNSPESFRHPRAGCSSPSLGSRQSFRRRPSAYEKPSLTSVSNICERAPDATAALSLVEQ
jgi:hypothetical protein